MQFRFKSNSYSLQFIKRLTVFLFLVSTLVFPQVGCSLYTAVDKNKRPAPYKNPNIDLFGASKLQLIDEIRVQRGAIENLEKEKETLLKRNYELATLIRTLKIKQMKNPNGSGIGPIPPFSSSQNNQTNQGGGGLEYDFHNKGVEAFGKGNYADALANFGKSLEINPNFFEAHTNMGVVFMTIGDFDKAIFHLKRALKLNPNFEYAQTYLEKVESIKRQKQSQSTILSPNSMSQ
jgi:tetratricopeptide (TPR) repeat protein